MDASDNTRKKKAKAYYSKQVTVFTAQAINSTTALCGTCTENNAATPCIKVFTSYEEKLLYVVGKNACSGCGCLN